MLRNKKGNAAMNDSTSQVLIYVIFSAYYFFDSLQWRIPYLMILTAFQLQEKFPTYVKGNTRWNCSYHPTINRRYSGPIARMIILRNKMESKRSHSRSSKNGEEEGQRLYRSKSMKNKAGLFNVLKFKNV